MWVRNSKSCRNSCGIQLCDQLWMYIPRQSRQPNTQLRQRSCPWCFRGKRMERRNRRQVTLQREEIDTARRHGPKRDTKKARKRALLGPRWFRENQRKCRRKNGGDDETRTRDL